MEQKSIRVLIAENHRDLSEVMSQLIDTEPDYALCRTGHGRFRSPPQGA